MKTISKLRAVNMNKPYTLGGGNFPSQSFLSGADFDRYFSCPSCIWEGYLFVSWLCRLEITLELFCGRLLVAMLRQHRCQGNLQELLEVLLVGGACVSARLREAGADEPL